jgi:hypothetical protein
MSCLPCQNREVVKKPPAANAQVALFLQPSLRITRQIELETHIPGWVWVFTHLLLIVIKLMITFYHSHEERSTDSELSGYLCLDGWSYVFFAVTHFGGDYRQAGELQFIPTMIRAALLCRSEAELVL